MAPSSSSAAKGNNNKSKKPKRPLSGYNLFYRYKRNKVLEATAHLQIDERNPSSSDEDASKTIIREAITATPGLEGVPPTHPVHHSLDASSVNQLRGEAIRKAMEGHLFPNEHARSRLHRKVHGMGFVEMGRIMREMWASADEFTKGVFCELADVGRVRYRSLLAEYKALELATGDGNGGGKVEASAASSSDVVKQSKATKKRAAPDDLTMAPQQDAMAVASMAMQVDEITPKPAKKPHVFANLISPAVSGHLRVGGNLALPRGIARSFSSSSGFNNGNSTNGTNMGYGNLQHNISGNAAQAPGPQATGAGLEAFLAVCKAEDLRRQQLQQKQQQLQSIQGPPRFGRRVSTTDPADLLSIGSALPTPTRSMSMAGTPTSVNNSAHRCAVQNNFQSAMANRLLPPPPLFGQQGPAVPMPQVQGQGRVSNTSSFGSGTRSVNDLIMSSFSGESSYHDVVSSLNTSSGPITSTNHQDMDDAADDEFMKLISTLDDAIDNSVSLPPYPQGNNNDEAVCHDEPMFGAKTGRRPSMIFGKPMHDIGDEQCQNGQVGGRIGGGGPVPFSSGYALELNQARAKMA